MVNLVQDKESISAALVASAATPLFDWQPGLVAVQSEDSAEGDRSFRREADHGSGRKPIRRRSEATLALRCCQA